MRDVKPISARKMGELARLLEERGFGADAIQHWMIDNIKGLCFFLDSGFNFLGKEIKKTKDGFLLEVEGDSCKIVGLIFSPHEFMRGRGIIRVGDEVVSNGRFGPVKGTKGTVVRIIEPGTVGLTTDIIEVDFHDKTGTYSMKIKDLEI